MVVSSERNLSEKWFQKLTTVFIKIKKVIIKGCAGVQVPTWAYLILVSRIAQIADKIYYGEPRSAVKIFDKKQI